MSRKKSNGVGRSIPIYKSYVFKEKDPVIDELRTLAEDTFGGKLNTKVLRKIAEQGGPTASCMVAWFFGSTRRPQNPTIEAAGRAMGYRRVWRRL